MSGEERCPGRRSLSREESDSRVSAFPAWKYGPPATAFRSEGGLYPCPSPVDASAGRPRPMRGGLHVDAHLRDPRGGSRRLRTSPPGAGCRGSGRGRPRSSPRSASSDWPPSSPVAASVGKPFRLAGDQVRVVRARRSCWGAVRRRAWRSSTSVRRGNRCRPRRSRRVTRRSTLWRDRAPSRRAAIGSSAHSA